MTDARLPDGESRRLAAVRALDLLDTEPEERFDRITRLAALTLDMPIALISLIDADRQWFKSRHGVDAAEIPRSASLCSRVIDVDRPVVIRDLATDPHFADSPLVVNEPHVRFYAGVPVHAPDGSPVGTVCVLDQRPRDLDAEQLELLKLLAGVTEREFQSRELADTLALMGEANVRAAAVADSIIEGLITLSDDGLITSANAAAREMFAAPDETLVGTSALALLAEADRAAYREYLERYLRGEGSHVLGTRRQVVGRRLDGSTFDMELVVTITDTGRRREFVALCRDVSERVRMEQELLANREYLALLSDAALEGLAVRERGVLVEANRAFATIFGYEPGEVLGMTPADFMAPESHDVLANYFRDHEGELMEAIGLRKDGSRFPIEFAARDLSGHLERRVVAIRDITARREAEDRAEAELRATQSARRTIRAIVDATREAMLFLAADGRIAFVNQGLFNIFTRGQPVPLDGRGIEEFEEVVGGSFSGDGHPLIDALDEAAHDLHAEVVVILEQEQPEHRDLQLVIRPVLDPDAGYIGRLFVFRDITAEREADRLKSEFVSTVAHELRTPLSSIKGYVELLREGEAGRLAPAHVRLLAVVERNADRLAALVSDLLDVSQIEAGGLELQYAPERVDRAIDDAVALMRPQFAEKEQALTVEIADGLPAIEADGRRLIQVLTNLLSNAHKYTSAGGQITVRAAAGTDAVSISVADDGIGMSPDEVEQLFTKFYRARHPATLDVGGTGLGLAITRSLVELHGGAIDVDSTPGQGTTFTVRLPLTRETALAEDLPLPAPRAARILVVDDEPDVAELIRRYLERSNYEVTVAHTAADGQRLAREWRPDLITLDVVLPDQDGFALLAALSEAPETASIPVLMLSIVPEPSGPLIGAVGYLTKPVHEQELVARVAAALADRPARSVLVVDDDADARVLIARLVQGAGHLVLTADNGPEAVRLMLEHQPELSLIDVHMPGMDGIEVVRHVRADPRGRDLRVLMITAGSGTLGARRAAVEALGTELLAKPRTPAELGEVIARGLAAGAAGAAR